MREESLSIYRATGDKWVCGYLLWGIAKACLAMGDSESARDAIQEWTAIARKLGNRWITPYLLHMLGEALLIEGNPIAAARMLGAAEAGHKALGLELDATDRADWEATVARLGTAIDSAAGLRAWNEGRQLSLWEAIDEGIRTRLRAIAA
jgi:hypothetical protein